MSRPTTAVGMIFGWAGLSLLNPAFAAFVWRFSPVLTIVLAALFLAEKFPRRLLLPTVVMICGGFISTIASWHIVALGTALSILVCCAVAAQRLIAKRQVAEIHPNIIVFYRVAIAAVLIALLTLLSGKADFDVSGKYWLVTFLGAFLGPCLAHVLTFRSFLYWDLSRASIVMTAQPLFVLPLTWLVFGQLPTALALIGGLIILAGAFWLALIRR